MNKSKNSIYQPSIPEPTNEKLEELLIEKRQISKDKFLLSQLSFGLASLFSIVVCSIVSTLILPTKTLFVIGIVSLVISFLTIRAAIFLIFMTNRIKENETRIMREEIRVLIQQQKLNSKDLVYILPHRQSL